MYLCPQDIKKQNIYGAHQYFTSFEEGKKCISVRFMFLLMNGNKLLKISHWRVFDLIEKRLLNRGMY